MLNRCLDALLPNEQGARTILSLPLPKRCSARRTRHGLLRFVPVEHSHDDILPLLGRAIQADDAGAVNRELTREGFALPTEYETANGDNLEDERSTVEKGADAPVIRFSPSGVTVGESGRVYRQGRVISTGKPYGKLLFGAVRYWGVYLPRDGIVVVWSDMQTHVGGDAMLVRRVVAARR